MTEKEIEAIAREYAESTALDVEEFLLTEHGAYHAFKWLSRDYCIVPKSQARELAKLTFENGCSVDYGLIDGLTDWVCDNFSDEYHDVVDKGE